MARDGVRQTRAQHHELMLPLALGRAHRPPHRVIQAAELALGAGIHVAHAGHDGVRLVVQIQAVGDQFFQLDLRSHLEWPATAGPVAAWASVVSSISAGTVTMRTSPWRTITAFPASTLPLFAAAAIVGTRRTIFAPRSLSLRTLTLRTTLRLGSRLFGRFCHCRRCGSFHCRFWRGCLGRRRLRRRGHFRLHIIRHSESFLCAYAAFTLPLTISPILTPLCRRDATSP